jgi:hypothetical protein
VAYPGIFQGGLRQDFSWGDGSSTNSVEDRGQRERGSGSGSILVSGSTQFSNERNPYSDYVVTVVYSTELGIRLNFVRTSEFRGFKSPNPAPRYATESDTTNYMFNIKVLATCFGCDKPSSGKVT